jgi:hypothetical protein
LTVTRRRTFLIGRKPFPADAAGSSQNDFNTFAWKEFIALNWVADPESPGNPDPNAKASEFGKPNDPAPVVWESYKVDTDIFRPHAEPPLPWKGQQEVPANPAAFRGVRSLQATSNFGPKILYHLSKLAGLTLDLSEYQQAGTAGAWLTAQNGHLTLYEVRVNQDEYNYINSNRLYNAQIQQTFVVNPGINLPDGTLPTFNPPQPDKLYPHRTTDFDGLYEQPHDNVHGWVGPDMADNAYTAFDPIFWSYHANIDRMFELWLRAHPAVQFTSGFPLHPFAGPHADRFEFDDPRRFVYTTIGDMARDSRGLGYDFADPVTPDFTGAANAVTPVHGVLPIRGATRSPGRQTHVPEHGLYVVFDGVRCTHDSYAIDAFINREAAGPSDVNPANPHYVGRITRLGMGIEDNKGRCVKHGVTRVLNASANIQGLGLQPGAACTLHLIVTNLTTGELLTPESYRKLPGFEGRLVWGGAWPDSPVPVKKTASMTSAYRKPHACCPMSAGSPGKENPSEPGK